MLALVKLSETPKTITLGWTPVLGALGYEFLVDGVRVSHTGDPLRSSVRFGKKAGSHSYGVRAFAPGEAGQYVYPENMLVVPKATPLLPLNAAKAA